MKKSVAKPLNKKTKYYPIADLILFPLVYISSKILFRVRKAGINNLPKCRQMFLKVGIMPIRDHYYEPLFSKKHLYKPLSDDRDLPGIEWNVHEQLSLLEKFSYKDELMAIPDNYVNDLTYHYNNRSFETGDGEYWYNLIRLLKPKKILEIGSGNSTKMAKLAINKNKTEDNNYHCEHICIEPYEMPWLEKIDVQVIREKVELCDKNLFRKLESGDILFIDSSHMIRPQGDVLFEFLELLPILNQGVIVHIHDIFSPKDYLEEWVLDEVRFWNEQYLLEAFLTQNENWKIIGAVNFLKHNHYESLVSKCPKLTLDREPASFYIMKIK